MSELSPAIDSTGEPRVGTPRRAKLPGSWTARTLAAKPGREPRCDTSDSLLINGSLSVSPSLPTPLDSLPVVAGSVWGLGFLKAQANAEYWLHEGQSSARSVDSQARNVGEVAAILGPKLRIERNCARGNREIYFA